MKRWPLLLYPAAFRRRYGDEIIQLLDHSRQPVRDQLNVAVHAGHLRWDHHMTNAVRNLASVALAAAIFVLGFAINDLQSGIAEIHRHWWSTAAVLLVVSTGAVRATLAAVGTREGNVEAPDPGRGA